MNSLLIRPRDPLIFRDARPFSAEPGARAESLRWPLPGTFAGALRTLYGNSRNFSWTAPEQAQVLEFETQGPFLVARQQTTDPWTFFAAAPHDAVPFTDPDVATTDPERAQRMMVLRPEKPKNGAGVSQPASGDVWPMKVTRDVKPDTGLDYWSLPDIVTWLACATADQWTSARRETGRPSWHLPHIARETRTHVAIEPGQGTAKDGALFSTIALAFRDAPGKHHDAATGETRREPETALLCRYQPPPGVSWRAGAGMIPLGGERRIAALLDDSGPDLTAVSPELEPALLGQIRLRLLLLTPAIFTEGWFPSPTTEEPPPLKPNALLGLNLTLVGAAVGRRIPVSGWDMKLKGEKATRYAAPAGSVFFYKTDDRTPLTSDQIESLCFGSIADNEQDRRDGYGIVLPGVW